MLYKVIIYNLTIVFRQTSN